MYNLRFLMPIIIFSVLLHCRIPSTPFPVFSPDPLHMDKQLTGIWYMADNDSLFWDITSKGDSCYRIVNVSVGAKNDTCYLQGVGREILGCRFIQLFAEDANWFKSEASLWQYMPVYTFFRYEIIGDTLYIHFLDIDWLEYMAGEGYVSMGEDNSSIYLLFTEKEQGLIEFLEESLYDEYAYESEPWVFLVRRKGSVRKDKMRDIRSDN